MKNKITKDTTLAEILGVPPSRSSADFVRRSPLWRAKAEEVLAKHGVPCVTCPMAKMEMDKLKIGEVCKMYGVDLEKLLKDLNF